MKTLGFLFFIFCLLQVSAWNGARSAGNSHAVANHVVAQNMRSHTATVSDSCEIQIRHSIDSEIGVVGYGLLIGIGLLLALAFLLILVLVISNFFVEK